MKSVFKITKKEKSHLEVLGQEQSSNQYTSEFSYTDCVSLNFLLKIDSKESEEIVDVAICEHTLDNIDLDKTIFKMPIDGLYKVIHMIIPTLDWLRRQSNYDNFEQIYGYSEGKIYKLIEKDFVEIDFVSDLLNLELSDKVSIFSDDVYTFNLFYTKKCFYDLIQELLSELCTNKCQKQNIFNRDILWMGINVIQYCLDVGNFYEAQRTLERLTGCGLLCKQNQLHINYFKSCGCNGRH